jgi:hypothetical protein
MTHMLVIEPEYRTCSDDSADFDPMEDPTFSVYCPGVTSSCMLWMECYEGEHPTYGDFLDGPDADEYEPVFHGVVHRYLDYCWMVEQDRCIVKECFAEADEHFDIARQVERIPGVYAVDYDWDETVYLFLLDEGVPHPEIALQA